MDRYMFDPHKNWTRRIDDRDKGGNMIAVLQHAGGDGLFLESQCFSEVTRACTSDPMIKLVQSPGYQSNHSIRPCIPDPIKPKVL
jgi:hypothetical protein